MSTTTKKHNNFVSEPMGDKPVTAVPGIGAKLGDQMKEHGCEKASELYGRYLVDGKNETRFKETMSGLSNPNAKQARDCHDAMKGYDDQHGT